MFASIYMPIEENIPPLKIFISWMKNMYLSMRFIFHNQHELNDKLSLVYGLRCSLFHNLGTGRVFRYENDQIKRMEIISGGALSVFSDRQHYRNNGDY